MISLPTSPPKNYKISSAFSYNFILALTLVKSKFMKLNGEHIRFVLDCMRENTTKIRNIKQYLKAALFNAPSTIGNYYTSLVAHDMASGALSPKKPQYGDPDYYSCNEGESL